MLRRWQQLSKVIRTIAILVIVGLLGVIGYELWDFYKDKVGATPSRAVTAYFAALGQGDYEEVYRLTDKDNLTDIYGRPITKNEFLQQLERATGEQPQPFTRIEVTKLFDRQSVYYYAVKLHSVVGGVSGQSHILVEVHRRDKEWLVTYPFAIVL